MLPKDPISTIRIRACETGPRTPYEIEFSNETEIKSVSTFAGGDWVET
jgi:hypothetical protein